MLLNFEAVINDDRCPHCEFPLDIKSILRIEAKIFNGSVSQVFLVGACILCGKAWSKMVPVRNTPRTSGERFKASPVSHEPITADEVISFHNYITNNDEVPEL